MACTAMSFGLVQNTQKNSTPTQQSSPCTTTTKKLWPTVLTPSPIGCTRTSLQSLHGTSSMSLGHSATLASLMLLAKLAKHRQFRYTTLECLSAAAADVCGYPAKLQLPQELPATTSIYTACTACAPQFRYDLLLPAPCNGNLYCTVLSIG